MMTEEVTLEGATVERPVARSDPDGGGDGPTVEVALLAPGNT